MNQEARSHWDDNGQEWVIRIHSENGDYDSLGGCVGEAEAKLVCGAINALIALRKITWDVQVAAFVDDGMVEGGVSVHPQSIERWQDLRHMLEQLQPCMTMFLQNEPMGEY